MKCVIIDNYDSFTYNLVQLVRTITRSEPTVLKNDGFELQELAAFDKMILSPGPGVPSEAGLLLRVIETYGPTKSILGICLGHQAIGQVYGATLTQMHKVLHGVSSNVHITVPDLLFGGIPTPFPAGHYHSWVLAPEPWPSTLQVTATGYEGNIMAIKHLHYDVRGLQFHPESILTPFGESIMKNWINQVA